MIVNAQRNSTKIEKMLILLNTTFEDRFKAIESIFNIETNLLHYATLFELKYINNYPLFVCKNIFAFTFKRIMLNITRRNTITTCKNCGKIITEEFEGFKPPKYCEQCEQDIDKKRKENKAQLDADQYNKKQKNYKKIVKLRNILKTLDKNNTYSDILNIANKISNHNDIRFKDTNSQINCYTLISKLENAIIELNK